MKQYRNNKLPNVSKEINFACISSIVSLLTFNLSNHVFSRFDILDIHYKIIKILSVFQSVYLLTDMINGANNGIGNSFLSNHVFSRFDILDIHYNFDLFESVSQNLFPLLDTLIIPHFEK
jgi:hypothetical protein